MLAKVIIENGQKKIQALTADTGTGAPVGSYLYLEKKSNPQGYLYCDGSTFDETAYPALYQYLGTNVLPDWREFSAVGAEQNTTNVYDAQTNPNGVIHDHDVFAQGEAKDDQLQNINGSVVLLGYAQQGEENGALKTVSASQSTNAGSGTQIYFDKYTLTLNASKSARAGAVTRGKRKAVFIYIKATSGLTENQQEDVLNTINENNSYSTEEVNTGKKWIDGKPIYRKVIEATLPSSGVGGSLKDLSALHIDYVTNLIAVIYNTTDDYIVMNGGYRFDTDEMTLFLRKTNGILYFYRNNADFSKNAPIKITLEYTKTTD